MGKKQKSNGLGRSLIKDKMNSSRGKKKNSDSVLHTSELRDGYDWTCLNVRSVTEENSLQEFLSTAELAGTEFQAEKLNIKFINSKVGVGLLTNEEKSKMKDVQNEKRALLKIPRRPHWDPKMSAEELHSLERETFLEWRRDLAKLQEDDGLLLTPYEKNLDFWRQLWRVVERSDIVVQILDARNPLLFRCQDLEKYVQEVDKKKKNLLLLNKSDFLTKSQRNLWAAYFDNECINVAFFSAKNEGLNSELKKIEEDEDENIEDDNKSVSSEQNRNDKLNLDDVGDDDDYETESEEEMDEETLELFNDKVRNSGKLLNWTALIEFFKNMVKKSETEQSVVTVGLVGYPNVGKSSTINALIQDKKTSVSATPGKTKHFQTLFIDSELMLCDCPGLVMPSFVYTKADLVVNGILPIDQMRDHVPPINSILSIIPRHVLEDKYSIMIPRPTEGEDEGRNPTAEEFLNAYGYSRGFMTQNGQPDNPRSSRYILKDFVNGNLLYCHAPPGVFQDDFHKFPPRRRTRPIPVTRQAQLAVKERGNNHW
ncbi:nucleostemin 3 isoform X3 [Lycorma delicatula]|uniref:nucleostemin 3 isoform X3 n=1 Tax=Lycorma delicatula TaxID=130591 RepID=UPI003F513960